MSVRHTHRPGIATFLVLWAVLIGSAVLVSTQVHALRQSMDGRRQVARVRAYWAARAGVEAQIAAITAATLTPDQSSATAISTDLSAAASGVVDGAAYDVRFDSSLSAGQRTPGAIDEHAKINVNAATRDDLLLLPDMDESIADAILDWIDADDDPREFGAESGTYLGMRRPYLPRSAAVRSIQELELVLGVLPEFVRGEDWNLNGVLDANEDDADASWPPDNADGKLDAGWSAHLTAAPTVGPGWGLSGQMRLDLTTANEADLQQRLGVETAQAQAILQAVQVNPDLQLRDFLTSSLSNLAVGQTGTGSAGAVPLSGGQSVPNLSREQLKAIFDEAWVGDPLTPPAADAVNTGKININTIDEETLQYVATLTTAQVDAIVLERQSRSGGFVSITDLLDIPSINERTLATISDRFDVRTHAFTVSSRGTDTGTGVSVELTVTLDRSRLPVEIRRVQVK